MRYGTWITICTFADGSQYQQRCFNDARGCGLEYRIHAPNAGAVPRRGSDVGTSPLLADSGGDK